MAKKKRKAKAKKTSSKFVRITVTREDVAKYKTAKKKGLI